MHTYTSIYILITTLLFLYQRAVVTSASPWAFYNETYLAKDTLLSQLKEFALKGDIKNFVHAYSNQANHSLLKANGLIDKNGNVNFDLLDQEEEGDEADGDEVPTEESADNDYVKKRQSIQPTDAGE